MVHNTRMGVVMNQIFADISSFESLAGGSAGSSLSAFSDRKDVVVQNVDVGLATLSAIANDDELSRLVNFLKNKDRLEYADAALRGHSMGSIADLKRVLIHGIGVRSMEDFDAQYGSAETKTEKKTETTTDTPAATGTAKSERKLGWWGRWRKGSRLVKQGKKAVKEKDKLWKLARKAGKKLGTPIKTQEDFLAHASEEHKNQYEKLRRDYEDALNEWMSLYSK